MISTKNLDDLTKEWEKFNLSSSERIDYSIIYDDSSYFQETVKSNLLNNGFCLVKTLPYFPNNIFSIQEYSFLGTLMNGENDAGYSNTYIRPINGESRYIYNNKSQPLHSDFGYSNNEPDIILLYCEKQAETGGESIIVTCDSIINHLNNTHGNIYKILYEEDSITYIRENNAVTKSFFCKRKSIDNISFSLFSNKILAKSNDHASLFNEIINYTHKTENQTWLKINHGDCLILNNRRVLHGRNAFYGDRLMKRYCYRG